MRLAVLLSLLLPAAALSDTTAPGQGGWVATCASRVERARAELAQTDRRFAAATVLRERHRDLVDLVVGESPRYLVRVAPWPGEGGDTGWIDTHRGERRPTRVDRWRQRDRRQGWVVAGASDEAARRFVSRMMPVVDACLGQITVPECRPMAESPSNRRSMWSTAAPPRARRRATPRTPTGDAPPPSSSGTTN